MIYLFDENEKLFKLLKKESLKSADQTYSLTTENYVSDRLTIETKGMNAGEVEKAHFMAIQSLEDRHKFHYFFIARKETDKTTILEGVQSGIEELRKTPVYDKRPRNLSARNVIEDLLRDTNWVPRFIADTGLKNTNIYYTSVFEALKKVCKVWGLEMQFFVEMNGNQIGARFIDFKKKIGEATGKRVVYGHNALKILSESESTNLFTALVGRGKGEQVSSAEETGNQADGYGRKINFEDIVWLKSKGNPVDKPAGQKYVEIPEMTAKYGILNADGTRRPKIGFIDFGDEEDREALLQQTYEALKDSSRPQLTLKTSSVYLKNVAIGDTIRVVRHDRKLDYETRVFETTINRLNNKSTDIKLGDRTSQSNEAKIQIAADKAVEEFVEGNFNDFIKNIPDFLPSADGFNNNWYSEQDPTVTHPKKVMIGDIWYKPDPEHEGHKIMLRWTGEMWEEILRTYNAERLKEQIEAEMAEVNGKMKGLDAELKTKVAELLAKAGVAESAADEAKRLAEKAGADVTQAQERSELAIRDALAEARRLDQEERKTTEAAILAARNKANDEARRLVGLSERALQESINDLSTEVTKTNDAIKLKADKTTVDNLTGKVSQAEATLRVQAGEIAKSVKTADFDKEKEKLRNAETNIRQLDEKITTEISRTEAKIPRQVGSRNFIKNSELTEFSYSGRGVYDLRFWIVDDFWKNHRRLLPNMVRVSFDIRFEPALPQGVRTNVHFSAAPWYNPGGVVFGGGTTNLQHFDLLFDLSNASESYQTDNVFIRFTDTIPENTKVIVERFTLHLSEMVEVWEPAFEDTESELESVKTTITQTSEGTNQLSERFTQSEGKMSRQETKINQLIGEVSSKVSQTDYNNLKRSVDSHATEINQTKSAINLKADRSQIDDLSSRFRAELQVANDAISAKVSKSEFNNEKNRVTNAETQINAIAGQISTKLSRTEVNQLIDTKGFITNSTFTNAIEQTERGLTTRIAQVENQIPDGYSGANLILEGARQTTGQYWENSSLLKHDFYHNSEKYLFQLNTNKSEAIWTSSNRFKVKRNTKYSISFWTFSSGNMKYFDVYFLGRKKGEVKDFTSANRFIRERGPSPSRAEYVTATFDSGDNDEGLIRLFNGGSNNGNTAIFAFGEVMLVEGNTPARYSPSPDELATTTALHEVRDTVDSHTRTLVSQGRSISQVVQTAEGIVSRVANTESNLNRLDGRANFVEGALNATKNEVSQLAGSWAVRNLTDSGTVLNQLNLNKDGSVKIDGSLVQITGRTYIQDGVISSAKIGNLDAGKITTGTLNAARVTIINMDASNIVTGQMSANRIRGGTISALNDRSQIDLQNGRFYVMDNNAGFFRVDPNAATTGMKFINYDAQIGGQTRRVSKLVIGGDRRQESSDSNFGWDKGGFTGIVISTVKGAVSVDDWQVDDVQMVGDRTVFTHSYYEDKSASNVPQQGWQMFNFSPQSPRAGKVVLKPYNIPRNNSVIETGKLYLFPSNHTKEVDVEAVLRELKNGFVHIKNAGFSDAAATAIVNSINRITSLGL